MSLAPWQISLVLAAVVALGELAFVVVHGLDVWRTVGAAGLGHPTEEKRGLVDKQVDFAVGLCFCALSVFSTYLPFLISLVLRLLIFFRI